jgi:hypothetical protein
VTSFTGLETADIRDKENMPDLRVDAIARLLVGTELTWLDARREVLLHSRLFAPKEASHCDMPDPAGLVTV